MSNFASQAINPRTGARETVFVFDTGEQTMLVKFPDGTAYPDSGVTFVKCQCPPESWAGTPGEICSVTHSPWTNGKCSFCSHLVDCHETVRVSLNG